MAEKRRNLSPQELLAAAETLQVAILDGISRARRWAKSELAFQGGTSLHLAYGSPRASEDLDFIIASDKGLAAVMQSALTHARAYVRQAVGADADLELKARGTDGSYDPEKNPRIFTVSFRAPAFLEAVKIKVEFYVAQPELVANYASTVRASRLSSEAQLRRPIKLALSQAIVPTGELTEIFADKIYAIAARPYLKHRDVFDLWWLDQQGAQIEGDALVAALQTRQALYPSGPTIETDLAARLTARAAEITASNQLAAFATDMTRWLALAGDGPMSAPENLRAICEVAAGHVRSAAETLTAAAAEQPRGRQSHASRAARP